jgi:hypothetical protein
VLASFLAPPARAEQLVSLSLICVSFALALIAFGFLRHQTSNIQFTGLGLTIQVGGAIAAALVSYAVLQFGVRGTTTLYVELLEDGAAWRPQNRDVEFTAALNNYDILAAPQGNSLRFPNIPIFETLRLNVRDVRWTIEKVETDDYACSVSGTRLKGWCTTARASMRTADCNSKWQGSSAIPAGSFHSALTGLTRRMQDVGYRAQLMPGFDDSTRQALETVVAGYPYNGASFCQAINEARVTVEQKLQKRVRVKVACHWISVVVEDAASGNEESCTASDSDR